MTALEDIKERWAKVTPWLWYIISDKQGTIIHSEYLPHRQGSAQVAIIGKQGHLVGPGGEPFKRGYFHEYTAENNANANAIAAAPQDIARLVAAVEFQREQYADLATSYANICGSRVKRIELLDKEVNSILEGK